MVEKHFIPLSNDVALSALIIGYRYCDSLDVAALSLTKQLTIFY